MVHAHRMDCHHTRMLNNLNDKKQGVEDNMDTLVNKSHSQEDEGTKLHTQESHSIPSPLDSTVTSLKIDEEDDKVVTDELSKHAVGFVNPDTEVNYGKPEQECLLYNDAY